VMSKVRAEAAYTEILWAELERRARFREELREEWQRRRERCADDVAKAAANGDLTGYRTALWRWRQYYAARDEPPPAA